jgi:integrase
MRIRVVMPSLKKTRDGWLSRKAIPPAVRQHYVSLDGKPGVHEERFRKPADWPEEWAKVALKEWDAAVGRGIAEARAKMSGQETREWLVGAAKAMVAIPRSPAERMRVRETVEFGLSTAALSGPQLPTSAPRTPASDSLRASADPSTMAASEAVCRPLELFNRWCQERKPAPSTSGRWRSVFTALNKLPQPVVDKAGAVAWKDALLAERRPDGKAVRSAVVVRNIWLKAARRIYDWALENGHVDSNPFLGVKVAAGKAPRKRPKELYEVELRVALGAALGVAGDAPWDRLRRFGPWILLYSGCRSGELCQLRGCDVSEVPGVGSVMSFTPDAGTVKTGEARPVPVHEHLVEMGFVEMAKAVGPGPLFHEPDKVVTAMGKTPAVQARERLAAWVRSIGVTDPNISPLHAFRHSAKRRWVRAGIEPTIRDALAGHAPRTISDYYEQPDLADLAEAMARVPRFAPTQG